MTRNPKKKFYVVWYGKAEGVFDTWDQCQAAIKGVSNARFRSFTDRRAAELAYEQGVDVQAGAKKPVRDVSEAERAAAGLPIAPSLCVDAAWNAETKVMEYRGVWFHDRSLAFAHGPIPEATNNLGEFLAIVHALALLQQRQLDWPVYSDSQTAISWVRRRRVNSKSMQLGQTGTRVNDLVARAQRWLAQNTFSNPILKWETAVWGEVPADFGRK